MLIGLFLEPLLFRILLLRRVTALDAVHSTTSSAGLRGALAAVTPQRPVPPPRGAPFSSRDNPSSFPGVTRLTLESITATMQGES
ncbi:hypothetical protein D7003_14420 [Arthrobacter oryzae]|uniref:Uncharacterized protein n=1 Tax=Arthrobacter oryzae TaxID=409290 RepID=A0A3N0BTF0_9MICC|nr:hypothetical protein D7003_14420 [Arthrobacter oryzae]